jgi:hypothetical protein
MGRDSIRSGIINPNATNSLVLFLFGSIVAGFAAGLGWGLATKVLEKGGGSAVEAYRAARRQRAYAAARRYTMPYYYR